MYSRVLAAGLYGLNCEKVWAEADVESGLMSFSIVGLANQSIKESKERVRSAISNCNFEFPDTRITVNLTPAGIKKEGSHFDLAIALAILLCNDSVKPKIDINEIAFLGELTLDGRIDQVSGLLPMAIGLRNSGVKRIVIPKANLKEAQLVLDVEFFGFDNLFDVVQFIISGEYHSDYSEEINSKETSDANLDFADIKGQEFVKRAAQIAAAGFHGMLMIGPPGVGKSMIGKRLSTILPELSYDEQLEVMQIYSVAGLLNQTALLPKCRPFRSPHHSISSVAMVGGGSIIRPGEVSLAHNGVLFLDELPEFKPAVLDCLRQPLEDGEIHISRISGTFTYPAKFMLVAASNPCKCGYYGDSTHVCTCNESDRKRYMSRISGPLIDRIDLHVLIKRPSYEDLNSTAKTISSNELKRQVVLARYIQQKRYKDIRIKFNSELSPSQIKQFCQLNAESQNILEMAFSKWKLSARSYHRIIKISRTIADLNNHVDIKKEDVLEALNYRLPEGLIK